MSRRADGTYRCDRCGADINKASISDAALIAVLEPTKRATVWHLHLCHVNGCTAAVLNDDALADWMKG